MDDSTEESPKQGKKRSKFWEPIGLSARLRAYFLTGILVTAPMVITFYLAWLLVDFVDSTIKPLIPVKYNPDSYLPFSLPGIGVLLLAIVLTLVGMLTAGFIGRVLFKAGESVIAEMPVVRSVYGAVKQILETVLAQQSAAFREAVLVEYPRRGLWAIAFITGRTKGEVQNLTEEEVINIFLPTTPNPTSGFLLFVPAKDLVPLSMTVEEAIKMVISGGIVTPPDRRPAAEQEQTAVAAHTYEEVDIIREKDRAPMMMGRQSRPEGHPRNNPARRVQAATGQAKSPPPTEDEAE
ncbi:MAG: DUF502 domain-containing protein [Magnetospiraceae bacterium]